jgi:hydroxyacylglutathione hydrolase
MEKIFKDLYQTEKEHPIPDLPGVTAHAYLLIREQGNVLFYNTSHKHELEEIQKLGGITHQFLGHWHESGTSLKTIKQVFGSELIAHADEASDIQNQAKVSPDVTFYDRIRFVDGIDAFHVPGHTPGSAAYLCHSPHGKTYLFTGDTIGMNNEGRWENGYLAGVADCSKQDLKKSLEMLRTFSPDVVLPAASEGKYPFIELNSREKWHKAIDEAMQNPSLQINEY